jgi:uncharacterized protein (DUF1501 family)
MNNDRRKFLKQLSWAGTAPIMLNHLPIQALASNGDLQRVAASTPTDRVLVLIQLHGGNDGLNTVIPVNQYDRYYTLRANVAIPDNGARKYITLDNTMPDERLAALHPDMAGLKELYDQGKTGVVQNVAYHNINGSHFRSRDIWFMGGDSDEYLPSGWMGRYLDTQYPGYPENYPNNEFPDPPAIEVGNAVTLGFHRANGIPMALAIRNPQQFYNLITSVGGVPPESITNTHYGKELRWIMDIEEQSNVYANRLRETYEKGANKVIYPEKYPFNTKGNVRNGLAPQLKMVSRLLSGGSRTKIFLVKMGGFDTHAEQVEQNDPSMGRHAALLYHISSAVQAFQNDLKQLGLEDRVLTMTFSEFGRRAFSNGSYGTDHGRAAPMFLFGKYANAGVLSNNPDLNNLRGGNLEPKVDYRQIFRSVLKDWMGASNEVLAKTRFNNSYIEGDPGEKLPEGADLKVVNTDKVTSTQSFIDRRFHLKDCYPNPAKTQTTIGFYINRPEEVKLKLIDQNGREVKKVLHENRGVGEHSVTVNLQDLKPGVYFYQIRAGILKDAKRLVIR